MDTKSQLTDVAQKLVDALEKTEPAIKSAFTYQAIHGGNYSGPTYGKELEALKAVLASHAPARGVEKESEGAK